jgi:threonine aldolase
VTKVEPSDVAESVVCYDKKTKKVSSAKNGKGDLVHRMQFLAKDVSTQFNNNVYRMLLYTHEGLGQNFLGKATNLHRDAAALKKVRD